MLNCIDQQLWLSSHLRTLKSASDLADITIIKNWIVLVPGINSVTFSTEEH